jgi:hypothetical protein
MKSGTTPNEAPARKGCKACAAARAVFPKNLRKRLERIEQERLRRKDEDASR